MQGQLQELVVREALPKDVPSMTTVFPRAFYPVNKQLYSQVFPDTQQVRDNFWTPIFEKEIKNPVCHPLIIVDECATDESKRVIGMLCMRLMDPKETGIGFWSTQALLPEQNLETFAPAFASMEEYRRKIFGSTGRHHYLIQVFGIDNFYKGIGAGSRLLRAACNLADEQGYEIFVQANAGAKGFYEKFNFVDQGTCALKMADGQADYMEHHLVRLPGDM